MKMHKHLKMTKHDADVVTLIKHFLSSQGFHDARIILFGSRARGDMVEEGDYDFMILVEQELPSRQKRALQANIARYLIRKKKMLPMDVIIKSKKRFERESKHLGNLAYTVSVEGVSL